MKQNSFINNNGVTLIELMVALAIVSIVSTAIYITYESQVRSQIAQDVALELQQGLRGALAIMEREIRTAGMDPRGTANARILIANAGQLHFTRDITGGQSDGNDNDNDGTVDNAEESRFPDGDTDDGNEDISYMINTNGDLGRQTGGAGGHQSFLDNVDALNFVYLDQAGNMLNSGNSLGNVAASNFDRIRTVEITIVASQQTERGLLRSHKDTLQYTNQQGEVIFGPANDASRRFSISTSVNCRNL